MKRYSFLFEGNKYDLFENEEVDEKEDMEFADKIKPIFDLISVQNNTEIIEIFEHVWHKFLI